MSTLAPSFLIGSSSYLQVSRTSITSRTSSKFGQMGPRTAELAALECLEKSPLTYNGRNLVNTSSFIFDSIILILAGNEDMHESLGEFKFRPDTDTNTRVICPCASEKLLYNVLSILAPSFLIESFSYLQVSRTSITSRTSSKFGQIGPRTAELAALERLEKSPLTYNGRNLVNTLAPSFLIGSSSFLQVSRTCMKAWLSSNFGKFATELRPLIDVRI